MKTSIFKTPAILCATALGLAFTQVSCSKTESTETSTTTTTTREQAYNDYKDYVASLESDVERGWDTTTTDGEARMNQYRTDYETRSAAVARYENELDETQKQEYAQLQSRYNTAWATREEQYNTWMANNQSGGNAMSKVDMSSLDNSKIPSYTATDIRTAYEAFVAHVDANKSNFSNDDWKTVETYWNQLDDRKNAVQSQLSDKDKWEIAKAKTKYIAMKNASKLGNSAENVGSGAKEVGKDVGSGAKEVGKDIGSGAKKVGKAIGNTVKKGTEKVDNKLDDDNN
ncbi:DUF6565 domain-containing protein [Rufibacter sp. LB8]|uniref:DUF6565 domain-containing protein n=1 Tax=Rufibacter sp. LB8 TaxID=2777781 RepID=UPI00178C815B|nr:DUF6565 domain-containing protein [Rufibacter sp. LB8]